ncbi:LANO_0F07734g1_1 [Lachancea nothofagi CBS 11611]|uniref:Methionyl-tRNA formyltransferase, mitochondrial n=1 Tax=Lachancea nothofagi CBS 11611 TaxID=1266666 RepID=A0A1G4K923_9SACH|nr:LANO_0F07734g1_1 [Lachancea nothofagi CBS 11611]
MRPASRISRALNILQRLYTTSPTPLNILFFGSDQFSIHSLNALHQLKNEAPDLIGGLRVVTKPTKKCGRNLSVTKTVPIADFNAKLGLPPIIECDSREEMLGVVMKALQSERYDMIVAVSFGKLIPKELLSKVPYTLNVHPSLLPRYKGSSPIQYALLEQDDVTGVSIQTLHPEKFDCGKIIAQTQPLKLKKLLEETSVSELDLSSYASSDATPKVNKLMDSLGYRGSELLADVIRNRLYDSREGLVPPYAESYAPKITTQMRQIQWASDTALRTLSKFEALGSTFALKETGKKNHDTKLKRVIFHSLTRYESEPVPSTLGLQTGSFEYDATQKCAALRFSDGNCLKCTKIQFEGFKIESPEQFFKSLRKRCGTLSYKMNFV